MAFKASILKDSRNAATGDRLTTFEITFPRIILAEFNTHRILTRNLASSRAIPVSKLIASAENDPFIPIHWGKNEKGMQASEELSQDEQEVAKYVWLESRDKAVESVDALLGVGVHKQIANRLLEPFLFVTAVVSGTTYDNFFKLRCHKDAQPEIQKIAMMMRELYLSNSPEPLHVGEWHMPLLKPEDDDLDLEIKKKVSIARCARVSYLTHHGTREISADLELFDRLTASNPKHLSPTEHVAQAASQSVYNGNFKGWTQYRKTIEGESGEGN